MPYDPSIFRTDMRSRHHWLLAAAMTLAAVSHPAAQKTDPPARPDLVREPYNEADVAFMAGMIPHHAQAVLIAGWAGVARRPAGCAHALRADRRRPARRDRDDAQLAARSRRGRARGGCDASPDEDERRRARHADAGHAHRRGSRAAGQGAERRLGHALPQGDDSPPRRRAEDGRRPVRIARRDAGRGCLQVRLRHVRRSDGRDRTHAEDACGGGKAQPLSNVGACSFMCTGVHS